MLCLKTIFYDDVANCNNHSDLRSSKQFCKCFVNRLQIIKEHMCDNMGDCYDMSDKCLCEVHFDSDTCANMLEDKNFQYFDNENRKSWRNFLNYDASITTEESKSGFIECRIKFDDSVFAITCDGRPECRDFSYECQCSNPSLFCNDSCHSYFRMGDRHCDKIEGPAWQYINRSDCPRGFDEMFYPKRFKCHG